MCRPTGCVDHYLKQMARLQAALDFFQENNPHSVELATLVISVVMLFCFISAAFLDVSF